MRVSEELEIPKFKVSGHHYLKGRGGFVIGDIVAGVWKCGMEVVGGATGVRFRILGIEYLDNLRTKVFQQALVFEGEPAIDVVEQEFPVETEIRPV